MNLKIVETEEDFNDFIKSWNRDECIFDIIQRDIKKHPIVNDVSLILTRTKDSDYILPIFHNEKCNSNSFDLNRLTSSQRQYVFDKKNVVESLPLINQPNIVDINIEKFINGNNVIDHEEFDTSAHKFFKNRSYSNVNDKIPILKHYEKFCNMCDSTVFKISDEYKLNKWNNDFVNSLVEIEQNGIKVDENLFIHKYGEKAPKLISAGKVHSQYHFYNSTSRPSNNFGGVNYSALNKEDGTRDCFISRYDSGGIFMVDYSAYHPRLIAKLVEYDLPVDMDAYEYLGKYFYNKKNLELVEIKESKGIVFRLLYGGIDEEFKEIPYFKQMSDYIDLIWDTAVERGYAETPFFKRKIYLKNIEGVNKNKLINYILQATETEKNCGIMSSLCSFLKDKEIKIIMYMYDSFIFDVSKKDVRFIKDIVDIVKDNNKFPVKCYFGKSLGSLKIVKF